MCGSPSKSVCERIRKFRQSAHKDLPLEPASSQFSPTTCLRSSLYHMSVFIHPSFSPSHVTSSDNPSHEYCSNIVFGIAVHSLCLREIGTRIVPHHTSGVVQARSQNCEKRILASPCLSVPPHATTWLPLDGFV